MEEIILVGGGGHCRSVIDVIEAEAKFKVAGIIDKAEYLGEAVLNYKVIGSDRDFQELSREYKYALVTIGQIKTSDLRMKLYERVKNAGFMVPTIVSPRAYVSKYAQLGEGTVIMHDALVNANVVIGKNCIINTKALIEHDSQVGDHCHISTSVTVNGGVHIADSCFIGSNAVTKEGIEINEGSFVKAGQLIK